MVQVSRTDVFLCAFSVLTLSACGDQPVKLNAPYSQNSQRQIFARSSQLDGGAVCYITPEARLLCLEADGSFKEIGATAAGQPEKWFSVAAGYKHSCALADSGRLYCWGNNNFNQLGQPERPFDQPAADPLPVSGQWLAVAAGGSFTCGITRDHQLKCFGMAPGGAWELLSGEQVLKLEKPMAISPKNDWVTLSASSSHLCAVNQSGELWCLGENRHGRLDLNMMSGTKLQKVNKKAHFVYVNASENYTCAITSKGQLFCHGDARVYPEAGSSRLDWWQVSGGDFASVALGPQVLCTLDRQGQLSCFGDNRFSQLGLDTPFGQSAGGLFPGKFVAAMPFGHTNCGLKDDGSWWCAGAGHDLTSLLKTSWPSPEVLYQKPQQALGEGYGLVAAGQNHTCAVTWNKDVYCFGDNSLGQCGAPLEQKVVMQPQVVDGLSLTVELSCGANHCCARNEEGEVRCFGDNSKGQFAPGQVGKSLPEPQLLSKKFRTIAAGFEHTCGIDTDGDAICYGGGQAFGAAASSYGPFKLNGGPWSKVVMGRNNICFNNKYQLSCFGDNRHGQLFETGVWSRRSPNTLKMAAVKDVAMASDSLFVVKKDNSLACWGSSNLCWPAAEQKENTVRQWGLAGDSSFKAIWANEALEEQRSMLCGITLQDKVACMGYDFAGQFIKEPFELALSGNYKMVAIGGHHACLLNGAGELFCFGDNSHYQLGLPLPGQAKMVSFWPPAGE